MSAGTSVPRPRLPGLDMTDSALLASLLREAPAGFAFIGPDSRVLRMNGAMAALCGGSEPGRPCAEIWPADLAAAADAAVRAVAAGEPPVPQTEHVIADGEPADNGLEAEMRHWSVSWFPSADGEVHGVAVIAVDATAQHEAAAALHGCQEALRRSEERYRSLVQAGAQVVWVTGPDGEIVEDAPEWRSITGQTGDQYRSEGWLAAVHGDDRERVEASWRDCIRSGKVFDTRYRVRSRSGSYRHYDV